MATHDYVIANGTGAAVRSDLNDALAAIVSQNSNSTEPATTYAYQWWADTTTGLLKIRNAANSAWVTIGTLASTNLGLASLAGATFTGDVILGTTTALELPDGTTGERPGSPVAGMIRYNTTLTQFEGYKAGNWGAIGGGATGGGSDDVFYENGQTVTTNYTLTTSKNAMSAGPVSINSGVTVTVPSGQSWVIV
ncbi:MAG: hypothetical protein ACO32W_07550 [Ilumatobacteraceae bacterium]